MLKTVVIFFFYAWIEIWYIINTRRWLCKKILRTVGIYLFSWNFSTVKSIEIATLFNKFQAGEQINVQCLYRSYSEHKFVLKYSS